MRVLWFTWKDGSHPLAGGAEAVNEQIAARLVRDRHTVTFVVAGFPGSTSEETRDGYRILRVGNRWTVYWQAYLLYKRSLKGTVDLCIDEINTVPFFCKWYVKEKNVLFVHQLARQIWFHEIFFPLNVIGYLLEPIYLRLLSDRSVITVSESSKRDLMRCGFASERVQVMTEGVTMEPVDATVATVKAARPTLLALGAVRSMKRTEESLGIFERAKKEMPDLQLIVAGSAEGKYGTRVVRALQRSPFAKDIRYLGRVRAEEKMQLLTAAHLLLVTSVKEGWCLVVTEANRRGTPALVYDVDGLRDSVRNNRTGIVVPDGDQAAAASAVVRVLGDGDRAEYERLCQAALQWSGAFSPEASYASFSKILAEL